MLSNPTDYTLSFYNSEVGLVIKYDLNDIMCTLVLVRVANIFAMLFAGIKYNSNRSDCIWYKPCSNLVISSEYLEQRSSD